jgi:putative ABC transport system ATP-binding protein
MTTEDKTAVQTSSLNKTFEVAGEKLEVLRNLDLEIEKENFCAITGSSGSGKTTLLNVISGIDQPTSGNVTVLGEQLTGRDESFLSEFRCKNIGFVFQFYNLVSTLTAAENIAFPMEWLRKPTAEIGRRVEELLHQVGMKAKTEHFPFQLSGGEQQRIAFARAMSNDPPLLLIDEPTGNLDLKTGAQMIAIMQRLRSNGKTIIVATHDERVLALANQKFALEEGRLAEIK